MADVDLAIKREIEEKCDQQVDLPNMYKVILNNDDYTPMDFVVGVLTDHFFMTIEDASSVMMQIHNQGSAVCGIYSKDVAETKCNLVNQLARDNEYPLLCVVERD